jgi:hypothetical protein
MRLPKIGFSPLAGRVNTAGKALYQNIPNVWPQVRAALAAPGLGVGGTQIAAS